MQQKDFYYLRIFLGTIKKELKGLTILNLDKLPVMEASIETSIEAYFLNKGPGKFVKEYSSILSIKKNILLANLIAERVVYIEQETYKVFVGTQGLRKVESRIRELYNNAEMDLENKLLLLSSQHDKDKDFKQIESALKLLEATKLKISKNPHLKQIKDFIDRIDKEDVLSNLANVAVSSASADGTQKQEEQPPSVGISSAHLNTSTSRNQNNVRQNN